MANSPHIHQATLARAQVVSGSEQHRPRLRGAPASSDPQGTKKSATAKTQEGNRLLESAARDCGTSRMPMFRRATFQCEVDNNPHAFMGQSMAYFE